MLTLAGCGCILLRCRSDFGFDPLGLLDPVNSGGFITPQWLQYSEVITLNAIQEGQQRAAQPLGDGACAGVSQSPAWHGWDWLLCCR